MLSLSVVPRALAPICAVCILVLAGCGGAKLQYYRLSADGPAPVGVAGLAVGVGPVTLPGYVDRAELVFQNGPNEFQVPTNAHWASSLKENITTVLASDLGGRLHSGSVLAFPWSPDSHLRYSVAVDVTQFHSISGQGVILEASWRVLGGDGQQISRHNARFEEPVHGDGYDAVVAAQGQLLGKLADGIAGSLRHR